MTTYKYVVKTFDKENGTVDIPDEAVGVTVDYFGDYASVKYLVPAEGDDFDLPKHPEEP